MYVFLNINIRDAFSLMMSLFCNIYSYFYLKVLSVVYYINICLVYNVEIKVCVWLVKTATMLRLNVFE